MASEFGAIRVKSLLSGLDGADSAEYVHGLLSRGENTLLYVRVPDGFRCNCWMEDSASKPRGLEGVSSARPGRRMIENESYPSYMRLDHKQIQMLLAQGSVILDAFNAGGLFLRLKEKKASSIDFDALFAFMPFKLEPMSRDIARATPTAFDPAKGHSMVVKSFDQRWKRYSYRLHGVSFKDVFIGTEAPVESPAVPVISTEASAPDDPYNLKVSSPLLYAILGKAFAWRDEPKSKMKIKALAPEFWEFNAGYDINPRPFNTGRDEFAVRLANRHLKDKAKRYEKKRTVTESVPEAFPRQLFVNDIFLRALYAASRWSGAMEPSLGQDPKLLMELLVRLGFWDYEDDEVSALMYFITGVKHLRTGDLDFQHS